MKKKLLLLILMVLPLFISSCSNDDGKVDPMKWKTELKKIKRWIFPCIF